MSDDKPLIYVVSGAAGSGRREIIADLIDGGAEKIEAPAILTAETEAVVDEPGSASSTWRWNQAGEIEATWPAGAKIGFFLMDGRSNPVDQFEALKPWMAAQGLELARVICVIHCSLLEAHEPMLQWYDAAVHFSDIALLNRREGVANKWLSDYRARFEKRHIPCLVDLVKKGRVKNPALVLDLQTRRLSHWFDEEDVDDWRAFVADAEDVIIEDEAGEDVDDEDDDAEDEYLARYSGGGRRKVIPDINDYLD